MTAARPDTNRKTTTPLTHSCSNHGVIQVGPLDSVLMRCVRSSSDVCFVHLPLQYASHENYENWSIFVKVIPKILAVYLL